MLTEYELGQVRRRISGAVELEERPVQKVANVDDGRVRGADEWVQGHRPLAHDQPFRELGPTDQPEMHRERKPETADRQQPQRRPRDDLDRSMPAEPPYLVT